MASTITAAKPVAQTAVIRTPASPVPPGAVCGRGLPDAGIASALGGAESGSGPSSSLGLPMGGPLSNVHSLGSKSPASGPVWQGSGEADGAGDEMRIAWARVRGRPQGSFLTAPECCARATGGPVNWAGERSGQVCRYAWSGQMCRHAWSRPPSTALAASAGSPLAPRPPLLSMGLAHGDTLRAGPRWWRQLRLPRRWP